MTSIHILMCHKNWRLVGGVERHLFDVKEWLEGRGHEVIPFSMEDPENISSYYDQYFVSRVDMRAPSRLKRARATGRAVFGLESRQKIGKLLQHRTVQAAYVGHVYHQMGSTFLPCLLKRHIPTVLSLHDYKLGCANYRLFDERTNVGCHRCLDHKYNYLYAPIVSRCCNNSRTAGAVLVTEALIAQLLKTYQRSAGTVTVVNQRQADAAVKYGISATRIHLVPHYVDLSASQQPCVSRSSDILYVGRLTPEKGVDVLLRSAALSDSRVKLVGEGRDRAMLETLARDLNVDAQFIGWGSAARVRQEMRSASALVVPSVWPEVWGLVVNEAISARLPVIASDVGAMSDILADGRGRLVPAGDVRALASELTQVRRRYDEFTACASRAWTFAEQELNKAAWERRLVAAFASAGANV